MESSAFQKVKRREREREREKDRHTEREREREMESSTALKCERSWGDLLRALMTRAS